MSLSSNVLNTNTNLSLERTYLPRWKSGPTILTYLCLHLEIQLGLLVHFLEQFDLPIKRILGNLLLGLKEEEEKWISKVAVLVPSSHFYGQDLTHHWTGLLLIFDASTSGLCISLHLPWAPIITQSIIMYTFQVVIHDRQSSNGSLSSTEQCAF